MIPSNEQMQLPKYSAKNHDLVFMENGGLRIGVYFGIRPQGRILQYRSPKMGQEILRL